MFLGALALCYVAKYQQRLMRCQRTWLECPHTGLLYGIRISRVSMASPAGGKESRENEPEYVMWLEKGLSIIEAFRMKKRPLTITQPSQITTPPIFFVLILFLTPS